ncbi:N-ethylammeline chlorohydrolase [Mycobacterium antarcticum]|uniref:amidohydrolase family protein n=1 Tax=unclassified Mycolicibacterium TaxID=2636767 RepID=UPI00238F192E|nr:MULTISPECIES: amidohydrolase family protein [unclassified Mycolicibacterium]BDX31497.1 N-ethylammeline chlorohydrolase [Mycolicibacterium sp. TUM20985]GLP74844.1 N-ethylammeline chlorohydrolase [Mycolicibacterium sp. TUM20983]GLP80644.1 N-ethylammeline chlorohydrolase [Mycolicibacterium sp. TUM20984]
MSVVFRRVLIYDAAAPTGMTGPVDVLVEGDRITAIGQELTAPSAARAVEGGGRNLLLPGLINAHFHSPANHLKGSIPSLPLELFMLFESPSDPALIPSPREAYLRTMLGAIEMLQRGITCVQDDAFLMPYPDPEIIDAVASAYRDSGIRAFLALDQPELTEAEKLPFVDELDPATRRAFGAAAPASAARLLELYDHLIGTWHGAADDRIRAAVSISAPQRVSLEYFAALDDLAERHGLPLYAHMLETKVQRTLMTEQPRFAGRSLVQYTAAAGLLKSHTNVIHAVWVDDADMATIADNGSTVVHNPVSNLRLGSGVLPWRAMLDHGIPVALGTDEAICDDSINVWTVAKTAGLIHNVAGLDSDDWPSATEVLTALWQGGARATRRSDDLGAVAEGRLADLALVDLHAIAFTPLNDLREQLVHCEDGRDVVLTMVAGRVVAEHGHVTSVDETALLDEARELFAAKLPAVKAARRDAGALLPAYRHIVGRAAASNVGFTRWLGR